MPRRHHSGRAEDAVLVAAVNAATGAGLRIRGRAAAGELGGAILVGWPDGRPGVVTVSGGGLGDSERTAALLNSLESQGVPVARHEHVVRVGDRVLLVQRCLPSTPQRALSPRHIDEIVRLNERLAGLLAHRTDVPPVSGFLLAGRPDWDHLAERVPRHHARAGDVVAEIGRLTSPASDELVGPDLVHVDLTAANVLFDDRSDASALVDWNLGAYRGDRRLALVQTRFDREWFLQRAVVEPSDARAAHRLDELLTQLVAPDRLRLFWAYWLGHQLERTLRHPVPSVVDWQLSLAESRLG